MSLLKARVFQNSVFKQLKWLVSAPEKAYKYLLISETAEIGIGMLPMFTGELVSHESQRAWRQIATLACAIVGVDGRLLPISERTYLPLDPFNTLAEEEKKKLAQESELSADKKSVVLGELDSIASREHDKAVAYLRNSEAKRQAAAMFKLVMVICGIIIVGILILNQIKK